MPHCIIEYSNSIEKTVSPAKLMQAVHQAAIDSELFDTADIKTRAIAYEHFLKGDNKDDFICVTIKAMSGRTTEQKLALSKKVSQALIELGATSCTVTVEILDIDRATYAKSSL